MTEKNLAPHLMDGGKKTKSFPYYFTEEEITKLGIEAAHAFGKIDKLKAEKKAIVAQHDEKIKSAELEHSILNNKIVSGMENRDFNCVVTLDFATGKKHFVDVVSGKELGTQPLDSDDYQLKVKFDMKEAEKALEEGGFTNETSEFNFDNVAFEDQKPQEPVEKEVKTKRIKKEIPKEEPQGLVAIEKAPEKEETAEQNNWPNLPKEPMDDEVPM